MKTQKYSYFPFYPNDFLSDLRVCLMSAEQRGAYITLLCHCWINGSLPDDDTQLATLSMLNEGWLKGSSRVVKLMFTKKGDVLVHDALNSEREKYDNWVKKCSMGGQKSVSIRKHLSDKKLLVKQPLEDTLKGSSRVVEQYFEVPTPTPTPILELGLNNTNRISNDNSIPTNSKKPKPDIGVVRCAKEVLDLDLQIAHEKNNYSKAITEIFRLNDREVSTFARIGAHLATGIEAGTFDISIFKTVIAWAKVAKNSTVTNKKGLFVAKIKQETGFSAQTSLLKRGKYVGKK